VDDAVGEDGAGVGGFGQAPAFLWERRGRWRRGGGGRRGGGSEADDGGGVEDHRHPVRNPADDWWSSPRAETFDHPGDGIGHACGRWTPALPKPMPAMEEARSIWLRAHRHPDRQRPAAGKLGDDLKGAQGPNIADRIGTLISGAQQRTLGTGTVLYGWPCKTRGHG